jgi:Mn-containing catalase
MFHHSGRLQIEVRVDKPDPVFAKYLQQAIGGIEGEIRVAMQYFFQAMGARGNPKYRDLLMMTATEELSHIEFLAHAVALNLEGAPVSAQEEAATDPVVSMRSWVVPIRATFSRRASLRCRSTRMACPST